MDDQEREADIRKLRELIKDIKVAMFTTLDSEDGTLRSRPMMTQQVEFDGGLWFFTRASSPKVDEVHQEQQVNLSYMEPKDQRFVSVSGVARLVRDSARMKELWNPVFNAWFPNGLDDPDLALLRVEVRKAEYWDTSSSKVSQLVGFVKSLASGDTSETGKNEKLYLDS